MRIEGITIPEKKNLEIGLTEVYGVGRPRAREILEKLGVSVHAKPADLTEEQEAAIRDEVAGNTIEGDLRRMISGNIKRLKDISSYRGSRHSKSLPARGQRTKTNSRTRRGNVRKTMGTGRRTADKK